MKRVCVLVVPGGGVMIEEGSAGVVGGVGKGAGATLVAGVGVSVDAGTVDAKGESERSASLLVSIVRRPRPAVVVSTFLTVVNLGAGGEEVVGVLRSQ